MVFWQTKFGREGVKYLFVIPAFAFFLIFLLIPAMQSIYYSFFQWTGLGKPVWTGITNYIRAFKDEIFRLSFINNILYIMGTFVVEVGFGLLAALILNRKYPLFGLFRVMFFTPVVLSMVAAGLLWNFIYDPNFGVLNAILKSIGLSSLTGAWLGDPSLALIAVTVVSGWKYAGFYMMIFYAALQRIPQELYEAARLDGASWWTRITKVTLPLLRETVVLSFLICVTGGFSAFAVFYTMTKGQPYHRTEIMTTWIIKQAFDRNNMGYAAALTVFLVVLVLAFSIVYLKRTGKKKVIEY